MKDHAGFWNKQAEEYRRSSEKPSHHHEVTAELLDRELRGDVAAVGGLWITSNADAIGRGERAYRVTVVDVSKEMLAPYAQGGFRTAVGDARKLPFDDGTLDHIVYAQVLHHITGDNGWDSRDFVREALREAFRVLRPGGKVWLKEVILPRPIYAAELVLAPVTRNVLKLAKIPLVVLHSERFFRDALGAAGFAGIELLETQSNEDHWYDLIQPVVGLYWLWVPRGFYPVRNDLLSAHRPHH